MRDVSLDAAANDVRCPACHKIGTSRQVGVYKEWTLYECAGCGIHHFWPATNPGADWYEDNEMYAGRDLMVVDWLGWYHRAALENLPIRSGSSLDVGCGNGAFVAALRDRGFDASGIDFSERAIAAGARHFHLNQLYAISVEAFAERHPDRKFDLITAFEVLEHMDDSAAFVDRLKGLLRPGGWLIVSVPNRERFPRLLNEGDLPPHHFTRWSTRVISTFLTARGFTPPRVIVCPTRITLRAFFLYAIRFDLVVRMMRRAERAGSTEARERTIVTARRLSHLKERVADVFAVIVSPFLRFTVRGPMLVAVAQLETRVP